MLLIQSDQEFNAKFIELFIILDDKDYPINFIDPMQFYLLLSMKTCVLTFLES